MASKNFGFLEDINPEYYNSIATMEENAIIKPVFAAQECRRLLNSFVEDIQKKHNIKPGKSEHDNLKAITNNLFTGLVNINQVEYKVIDKEGNISTRSSNALFFLKEVGNSGAHKGKPTNNNQVFAYIIPETIIAALRVYYELFTNYYRNRLNNKKTKFLSKNVPIGEYYVQTSYVPIDSERSKCIKEYTAQKDTGKYSTKNKTAIIREYKPDEMEDLFLHRNIDAHSEALSFTYPNGLTVVHPNRKHEDFANFYVVYEFVHETEQLDAFLKKRKLSLKERILLCKKLAEELHIFHNLEKPIYHRMLNYTCIQVADQVSGGRGYIPYIIKFDFAKITSITEGTVFNNLSEAEEKESLKLSRYKIDVISPDAPWDKVDIYSLGVLFVDIMMNNVSTKVITEKTFEELIDAGISDGMIDIIDEMLCELPDERPDISVVLEAISKEAELHE